jgi:hypothetical protein
MKPRHGGTVLLVAALFMLVVLVISLFVTMPAIDHSRLLGVSLHIGPILLVSTIIGACVRQMFFDVPETSTDLSRSVIQDSKYWEAVTVYKDLPDGSSIALVKVTPDGQLMVISGIDSSVDIARQVLAHREQERQRWVQGGSHAGNTTLHCSGATAH